MKMLSEVVRSCDGWIRHKCKRNKNAASSAETDTVKYSPDQIDLPEDCSALFQKNNQLREMELNEFNQELIRFSRLHPNCLGKEAKGTVNWSDPEVVRDYLTNWRIDFFHQVISLMRQRCIISDGMDILEVGSGTGYLLRLITKEYQEARVTGLDTYEALNQLARFLCPDARIINADLFDPVEKANDLVICMETLEHLLEPQLALEKLLKMVKKSGTLLLTVPNGRLDSLPSMGKFPNGRGYWGHINFWSIESWEMFLKQSVGNFRIDCGEILGGKFLFGLISRNLS